MKNIGYSDFLRICQIDGDLDTWCDWLSIRPDGVYIKVPSTEIWLMPEERAELTGYHPTGNLSEPVLAFPCSIRELMLFLNMQAIGIEIDEKYMTPEQYEEVIAYLGATQTTYRLSSRVHALEHIINMAKAAVSEPNNYHSVWAEMVRLAELESPPVPIKGYVEGEGIKYLVYTQDEDIVRFFTKNALRKKMVRQGC